MKYAVMMMMMLLCIKGIAQALDDYGPSSEFKKSLGLNLKYPPDLIRDSIPSFITLKVLFDGKDTSCTIDFSDNAHPQVIKEFLRIKDKLNFKSVYKDLKITNHQIPVLIPIQIEMVIPSTLFLKPKSDVLTDKETKGELDSNEPSFFKTYPKSEVFKDMYTFKEKLAIGEFYIYRPISLLIMNN
ncbi:hypothetical protein ACFX5U_08350 [Sphingobacterium sp. SG20118]|uniref:hypothetical protein n=1 Tax=Sphingobacterium sp. SG20118 TaxID=3367156 RepID=UPI0037DFC6EF